MPEWFSLLLAFSRIVRYVTQIWDNWYQNKSSFSRVWVAGQGHRSRSQWHLLPWVWIISRASWDIHFKSLVHSTWSRRNPVFQGLSNSSSGCILRLWKKGKTGSIMFWAILTPMLWWILLNMECYSTKGLPGFDPLKCSHAKECWRREPRKQLAKCTQPMRQDTKHTNIQAPTDSISHKGWTH